MHFAMSQVRTFTAAGRLLGAFAWEGAPIAALGWTDEQDLMILQESGEVSLLQSTADARQQRVHSTASHSTDIKTYWSLAYACRQQVVQDARRVETVKRYRFQTAHKCQTND